MSVTGVQAARPKSKGFFHTLWKQKQLMIMSVPMLLYVILFNYAPMWGWITAFQDYKPALGLSSPWVGWKNFAWLFGREDFIGSIRNTLAMSVINLVFGTVAAVLLAVLLNEVRNRKFKRTVQTVTYLPHFLSMVIVVGMAQNLFASTGSINELLMGLGLVKEPVFFLGEGKYFWWMVGVINVWKEVGWGTIIYLAAITGIDPQLYEAAIIDGAGKFRQIISITIPCLVPTIVIQLILRMGSMMDVGMEPVLLLSNSVVMDVADVFSTYVYRQGIQKTQYSLTTACGLFQSVVSAILLLSTNAIAKKLSGEGIW
jgi:putative aldouronate transport system permease protein